MRRGALAAALLLASAPAAAHQRSQSFSTWRIEGSHVSAVWSVLALEATRLAPGTTSLEVLGPRVAQHVAETVAVRRAGAACLPEAPPRALRAPPGHVRVEARYRCPEGDGALEVADGAFFEQAPSHVHFARVLAAGAPPREVLFTEGARVQVLVPARGAAEDGGAGIGRFVGLGAEHILVGYDHLAFLLSLILLGGGARELVRVVTGFTVGHSVTLSLAALGFLRVDARLVDALIGFSIALVAAENLAVRGRVHGVLARASGAALVALAVLAAPGIAPGGPPVTTLLGLALFSACYLGLAGTPEGSRRLRPAVTLLFGLVHGFSFAGVLAEVGLPRGRLLGALFGFNVGVELGQIAAVLGIVALASLARAAADPPRRAFGADALSALLCALGLFWFLERAYS
jgi:HupE / UreJ protein